MPSAVAGQNVFIFGGGGGGVGQLGGRNLGGLGGNPRKIFEILIPKSLQMHQIIKTSSYIWGTHLLIFFHP